MTRLRSCKLLWLSSAACRRCRFRRRASSKRTSYLRRALDPTNSVWVRSSRKLTEGPTSDLAPSIWQLRYRRVGTKYPDADLALSVFCSAGLPTNLAPAGVRDGQAPSESAAPAATVPMHKLIGEWTSWFKPAAASADVLPHVTGVDGGKSASEAARHAATPPSQQGSQPACERQQAGDRASAERVAQPGEGGSLGREQDGLMQPPGLHPANSGPQATEEQPSDESQHEESRPQHAAAGGEHCDASSDTDVSMGDGDWDVSLSQSPAAAPAWRHGTGQHGSADVRTAQPSDAAPGPPQPSEREPRPSNNQPSCARSSPQLAEQTVSPQQPAQGAATASQPQPDAPAAAHSVRDACDADAAPRQAANRGGVGDAAQRALDHALDAMPIACATHPNFIILSSSSGDDSDDPDDEQRRPAARPRPPASPPSQRLEADAADARTPASAAGGAAAAHAPQDPRLKPEPSEGAVPPSSTQRPRQSRATPLTPPPMRSPARSDMRAQGWQPQHQQPQHQQQQQQDWQQAEPAGKAASRPEVRSPAVSTDREAAHAAKRRRIDGGAADAWRTAHGTGPLWGSEAPLSKSFETGDRDGVSRRGSGAKQAHGARAERAPTASPVKVEGTKRPASAAAPAAPATQAAKTGDLHDASGQQPAKRTKASVAQSRQTASAKVADPHREDVLIRPKEVQRQKQRAQASTGHQAAASGASPGKGQQATGPQRGVGQRLPGLGTPLGFRGSRVNTQAGAAAAASAGIHPGEGAQQRQQRERPLPRSSPTADAAKQRVPPGWVPVAGSGAGRPTDASLYFKQSGDILQQMMRDAGREVRVARLACSALDGRLICRVITLPKVGAHSRCSFSAHMHQFHSSFPVKSTQRASGLRRTMQNAEQPAQQLQPRLARTLLQHNLGMA